MQAFSSHDIFQTLYQQIMLLELKPGSTLRENALCEQFGVSRTPVRSVLQELRIAGLIEVTPYKSTRVTQLDFDTISQQIYLRNAVESAVMTDFAAACTPEQLAQLKTRNDALRRLAAQPHPDPRMFYELDSRLHESWFLATGKDQLWQLIQTSQNSYSRFRMLDLVAVGNFGDIVAEHDVLLDAIARNDTAAIRAQCSRHLYGGVMRLGGRTFDQICGLFCFRHPLAGPCKGDATVSRTATVTRKTRETNITVTLDLDGSGKADLHTGIGFFDHMLDGFARHGLFDLTLHCDGDLNVDCHHTIEDCGIALGTAIREALGDKAGIVRYGSCMLPMDETLALCAVDLGGRPYFVYDASFAGQSCGGMDVQMAREFFYAVSYSAMMNLHLKVLYGENDHHKLEAMYKAFAKALSAAARHDDRIVGVLSTKGSI